MMLLRRKGKRIIEAELCGGEEDERYKRCI
jgi:hypothetical protein